MPISLYTALVIQTEGNDIRCEPYRQDEATGKWAGAINLYHDGHFHTTLLSSNQIYDSSEDAVKGMEKVVAEVRAMKLQNPLEEPSAS
jgi:hypothetical protein